MHEKIPKQYHKMQWDELRVWRQHWRWEKGRAEREWNYLIYNTKKVRRARKEVIENWRENRDDALDKLLSGEITQKEYRELITKDIPKREKYTNLALRFEILDEEIREADKYLEAIDRCMMNVRPGYDPRKNAWDKSKRHPRKKVEVNSENGEDDELYLNDDSSSETASMVGVESK